MIKDKKKKKITSPGRIRMRDSRVLRHLLYRSVTTDTPNYETVEIVTLSESRVTKREASLSEMHLAKLRKSSLFLLEYFS